MKICHLISDWLRDHLGLPVILIVMAFVSLFYPKVVYSFFFPTKKRKDS